MSFYIQHHCKSRLDVKTLQGLPYPHSIHPT